MYKIDTFNVWKRVAHLGKYPKTNFLGKGIREPIGSADGRYQ